MADALERVAHSSHSGCRHTKVAKIILKVFNATYFLQIATPSSGGTLVVFERAHNLAGTMLDEAQCSIANNNKLTIIYYCF